MEKNRFFAIWSAITVSAIAAFAIEAIEAKEALAVGDLIVYDDALASGWQDWSYNGRDIDLAEVDPTYSGSHSVAATIPSGTRAQSDQTGAWSDYRTWFGTFRTNVPSRANVPSRVPSRSTVRLNKGLKSMIALMPPILRSPIV